MEIRNRREANFINRVNTIIESNLNDERFGVSALDGKMNMSRTTCTGRSSQTTGQSVSRFLRNTRLNMALAFFWKTHLQLRRQHQVYGYINHT